MNQFNEVKKLQKFALLPHCYIVIMVSMVSVLEIDFFYCIFYIIFTIFRN